MYNTQATMPRHTANHHHNQSTEHFQQALGSRCQICILEHMQTHRLWTCREYVCTCYLDLNLQSVWSCFGCFFEWTTILFLQVVKLAGTLQTWLLMNLGKFVVWDFILPGHHNLRKAASKKVNVDPNVEPQYKPVFALKIILKHIRSVENKVRPGGKQSQSLFLPAAIFMFCFSPSRS